MTHPQHVIRAAVADDAGPLASLIDIAGDGLPSYLWPSMAEDGETIFEIGQRHAKRKEGGFSYRNAIIADVERKVADAPAPIDKAAMPPPCSSPCRHWRTLPSRLGT